MHTLGDLEPGMVLEGVVTNVAAFGAFVDIGVHQDGLVHVSAMSDNFVADPRDVAKSGDVVQVKVLSVDIPRKRISLTMRLHDEGEAGARAGRCREAPAAGGRAAAGPARGTTRRIPNECGRPWPRPLLRQAGATAAGARRRRHGGDRPGGPARQAGDRPGRRPPPGAAAAGRPGVPAAPARRPWRRRPRSARASAAAPRAAATTAGARPRSGR